MLGALGTARVMTGGTLTIDGAEMIGSSSLNVDEGGVRLQPNDRGGFTCTVETGGKATVKGHWMDGDENGYRIAKSDDFIVDGELVLAYRTELSGNMTVENGGNLLIDENGALDLEKAGLLAYAHGFYYTLGRKIGKFGFSVEKKKKRPSAPDIATVIKADEKFGKKKIQMPKGKTVAELKNETSFIENGVEVEL